MHVKAQMRFENERVKIVNQLLKSELSPEALREVIAAAFERISELELRLQAIHDMAS